MKHKTTSCQCIRGQFLQEKCLCGEKKAGDQRARFLRSVMMTATAATEQTMAMT